MIAMPILNRDFPDDLLEIEIAVCLPRFSILNRGRDREIKERDISIFLSQTR